ncbi:hypothetical protein [Deinococcus maricopensis]|uniref:Tetratricopeptide repeat protein n=1 Tax=Deinococcus maricopensis (strain DSM 21211 / LMG 22137 / NRRL B-23946 / LB-34) TaxID=709986 RepID=E8U777_DEIML|nr:hypothetical protein [Deinococcus maricopensis]ADV66916.1 hypothetical protein Deima_1265 [Deinococcus maricopensis DSM 21211]
MRHFLTLTLAVSGLAFAASAQEASTLLDQGNWKAAADMALDLKTSDGYTIAAKATTLGASLSPDNQKKTMLEAAQKYAKQAIAANANNADAHFELARADGRLAQYSGILQSLGLAGEVKKSLDTAIKLDPKMAGAYVALGLWNAELASKGFIATASTGASSKNVVPNFERAIALEPSNPTHRLEYANALLKLDKNRNKAAALAQLQKAVSLNAGTYWEKQDLAAAQKLLGTLR